MKIETICCGCGRTIERDFIYCPWCGHLRIKIESREYRNSVGNHKEHNDSRIEYIYEMKKKIRIFGTRIKCSCFNFGDA